MKATGGEVKHSTAKPCAGEVMEDCEWVDDAVLNISAAFSLCHAHDYAQIEFEHKIQSCLTRTCQQWCHAANGKSRPLQIASNDTPNRHLVAPENMECESEGFEATKLAKPRACVLEDHGVETLGMEVQLQSIQIY
jgi:hypothetical protein